MPDTFPGDTLDKFEEELSNVRVDLRSTATDKAISERRRKGIGGESYSESWKNTLINDCGWTLGDLQHRLLDDLNNIKLYKTLEKVVDSCNRILANHRDVIHELRDRIEELEDHLTR